MLSPKATDRPRDQMTKIRPSNHEPNHHNPLLVPPHLHRHRAVYQRLGVECGEPNVITMNPTPKFTPGQAAYEEWNNIVNPGGGIPWERVGMQVGWENIAQAAIQADPVRAEMVEALKECLHHCNPMAEATILKAKAALFRAAIPQEGI